MSSSERGATMNNCSILWDVIIIKSENQMLSNSIHRTVCTREKYVVITLYLNLKHAAIIRCFVAAAPFPSIQLFWGSLLKRN